MLIASTSIHNPDMINSYEYIRSKDNRNVEIVVEHVMVLEQS